MDLFCSSFDLFRLFKFFVQLGFPLLDPIHLLIQGLFPLGQPAFGPLKLIAPVAQILLALALYFVGFFLGLKYGLFFNGFRALLRIVYHFFNGVLCLCDFGFGNVAPVNITSKEEYNGAHNPDDNREQKIHHGEYPPPSIVRIRLFHKVSVNYPACMD